MRGDMKINSTELPREYFDLTDKLSKIFRLGSNIGSILGTAPLKSFDEKHPDFKSVTEMQNRLREIAQEHKIPWAK